MAYIMLPGMGNVGSWRTKVDQPGKGWGSKKKWGAVTPAPSKPTPKPAAENRPARAGMAKFLRSAMQQTLPSSRDDGNWRQHSQKQTSTGGEKLPAKAKPSVSSASSQQTLPSGSVVQMPSTRSTDMTAPQDVDIATPPVDEKITPPAQMQDREITEQTYVDIPPAEEFHTPGQGQKKGIDKRLLIGGGIAAAALVAAFTLMD